MMFQAVACTFSVPFWQKTGIYSRRLLCEALGFVGRSLSKGGH
jgi:hypothetical protein